ncbi:MAG: UDP-N-acetylmuramate dehydrogenase [Deltaproteobacteria bacterium]|nr:UDP-N-acetylmuramate dehydrogenase [Deltaproteobacteria bacterium]MBW2595031.1 UDP-N-acetylmuramate dehydrogenase [Deltaproteobacteria bacterium]MBW2650607.1 UDP-N-acetylmuramate dehydrogenase [Deltaproteobacteria bacterium]
MITDRQFRDKISGMVTGRVLFDEPMSRHTSMGVGGRADALIFPGTDGELKNVVSFFFKKGVPFLPVGNCTNLIVKDGGYRGALLSLEALRGLEIRNENFPSKSAALKGKHADIVCVYAQAGVSLSGIVDFSAREALTGLEFCAGIPGSIGGGVKMNAGAWGREMKDVVSSVSILDADARMREIAREDLLFEYRNLILPEGTIITGADFHLVKGNRDEIRRKISDFIAKRREKHPLAYRSAGSVFKNPPGCPAGRMIEEAGLKGFRVGDAEVSEKHGNFIVNRGSAKAEDVITLIDTIQKKILNERGILLETELKIIGEGL